jgi:hypothetical protein
MGMVNVTLSDPPSCMPPNGQFMHVYVTVRSVQAHIDPNASDNSSGWRELAPQLASQCKLTFSPSRRRRECWRS